MAWAWLLSGFEIKSLWLLLICMGDGFTELVNFKDPSFDANILLFPDLSKLHESTSGFIAHAPSSFFHEINKEK